MTDAVDTIPQLLEQMRDRGAHPAWVQHERLSYAELADRVDEVAKALLGLGVRGGDRVALWLPNALAFPLLQLGAQSIGACVVPLNTRYRGFEAAMMLRAARPRVLVLAEGFLQKSYVGMLAEAGFDAEAADVHVVDAFGLDTPADASEPSWSWEAFLSLGRSVDDAALASSRDAVTPLTPCDILFTSGTTGVPRGAVSTQAQTLGCARVWAANAGLSPEDRYAIVNPFFHSFGYKAGLLTSFLSGSTVHAMQTFEPLGLLATIQSERISVLPGPPTLFHSLINHPRLAEFDRRSLRFSIAGATTVPPSLFRDLVEVLGFQTVAQAYGLTECVVATMTRADVDLDHVAHTTGPPVPGIEVLVVDPESQLPVGTGVDGEVLLRGAHVMQEYFEDPEATREAFTSDGWLRTGDIGHLDAHGCLSITDRLKDMFTVGGFNVYPSEVEAVLAEHPDVIEAAVVARPDERMGTVPVAHVVLTSDATADEAILNDWCRTRLANFKVPRLIRVVPHLPRNVTGKVLKRELRTAPPASSTRS